MQADDSIDVDFPSLIACDQSLHYLLNVITNLFVNHSAIMTRFSVSDLCESPKPGVSTKVTG